MSFVDGGSPLLLRGTSPSPAAVEGGQTKSPFSTRLVSWLRLSDPG